MSTPDATDEQERPPSGAIEKASHGQAEETPILALTGVTIAVGALVALVVGVSLLVYFLA